MKCETAKPSGISNRSDEDLSGVFILNDEPDSRAELQQLLCQGILGNSGLNGRCWEKGQSSASV